MSQIAYIALFDSQNDNLLVNEIQQKTEKKTHNKVGNVEGGRFSLGTFSRYNNNDHNSEKKRKKKQNTLG